MKRIIVGILVIFILTFMLQSDVVKKSKSEVSFVKYGKFKTERTEIINPQIKRTDSEDNFKGKGFLNKLAAKIFFKNGSFSKIIDLKKSEVASINHKKKRVSVKQIEKIVRDEDGSESNEGEESGEDSSKVNITKNKLTVSATGNKKMVNSFPSREYLILWEVEWESNEDETKGASKLVSTVWTTPVTKTISTAKKAESLFFKSYMKKLGLDTEFERDEILGGSWLRIFSSLSKSSSQQNSENAAKFNKELRKIKGYPVIIDGEYYASTTGKKKKKGLKGFLKKKKKKGAEEKPKFTFYTEVLELSLAKSDPAEFSYPVGYKVK